MRVLITGVSSFLGKNTAKALLQAGHQVIGVMRASSRNQAVLLEEGLEALKLVKFDFDDLPEYSIEGYREIFSDLVPEDGEGLIDVWIHFAWDGIGSRGRQDRRIQKRNYENSRKAYLMAYFLGAKRFFFAGSQAEYGRGDQQSPLPISEYGKTKLKFARWATEQEGEMDFIHLRIFSVYGYGDHPSTLINSLIRACFSGSKLTLGACAQNWNYLEITDFSSLMLQMLETKDLASGIYDIASYESKPLRDYVLEGSAVVMAYLYENAAILGEGQFSLAFGVRADNAEGNAGMHPDTEKIRRLGFQQKVPFSEGILRLAERFREKEAILTEVKHQ